MSRRRAIAGLTTVAFAATLALCAAGPVRADAASDRIALDQLFGQLKAAPDAASADPVIKQIWNIWTAPSDPDLAGRMGAVLAAEQSGDLPAAMALLQKLVVDRPDYAEAWNQRATIEYELNDLTASLADIDKVLTLEPRHFGALSGRVLVYLAEGDRTKALKAMLDALAVDPFLAEKALFPELSRSAVQI